MASKPRSNARSRDAILRDVYEENLRSKQNRREASAGHSPRNKRAQGASVFAWSASLAVVTVLVALSLGAVGKQAKSDARGTAGHGATSTAGHASAASPFSESGRSASVAQRFGLQFRTIVLDAGHGGRDPGAVGQQGLLEKEITLDVARRLKARLKQQSEYRILLSRESDETLSLRDRIEFANRNDADLFVSIHVNWLPVDSVAPIETYYYGPDSDPRAERLARLENRTSGYSVAEFNDIVKGLSVELKIQESRDAAHALQKGLVEGLHSMGREVDDWGAKSGNFMVLLGVEAPSVLAEIASLSNGEDEAKLTTDTYRERLAFLLEGGIVSFLNSHTEQQTQIEHEYEEEQGGV